MVLRRLTLPMTPRSVYEIEEWQIRDDGCAQLEQSHKMYVRKPTKSELIRTDNTYEQAQKEW